ncbi:MAG TPA: SDR family oxidoreductase [Solirubrobacteraceae bacterium]|nr:SDR family oxidoreductase [Solirubrobacteraceae bacterium]
MLATDLLRSGVLQGSGVLVAGAFAEDGSLGAAVGAGCEELGARVSYCVPDAQEEEPVDGAVREVLEATGAIDVLVVDGAALFARGGEAQAALRACVDASWNVTRAVVNVAFLPVRRGGRIVYLAPALESPARPRAGPARAGLENLARTLSIEWARHGITTATIAPGRAGDSSADEVAALTAYLASPAGAYFSGCLFDLAGTRRD